MVTILWSVNVQPNFKAVHFHSSVGPGVAVIYSQHNLKIKLVIFNILASVTSSFASSSCQYLSENQQNKELFIISCACRTLLNVNYSCNFYWSFRYWNVFQKSPLIVKYASNTRHLRHGIIERHIFRHMTDVWFITIWWISIDTSTKVVELLMSPDTVSLIRK